MVGIILTKRAVLCHFPIQTKLITDILCLKNSEAFFQMIYQLI